MKLRSVLVAALGIAGVTLLALGLRLYKIDGQSLWYDEAFSVYLARMAPPEIVARTAADIQPPLYYLLLHGWIELLGSDEPALRGLSALFGVLSVPLLYAVAHRLFRSHLAGALAALFLAISPLHIWYGQEVRMYTLLIFLCLLSSYILLHLVDPGRERRGWPAAARDAALWLAYAAASVAALYTHYFALFVLAFQGIYVLAVWGAQGFRPARLLIGGIASGAAILLAYAPWLPHLVARYGTDASYWPGQLRLDQVLVDIALSFVGGEALAEQPGLRWAAVYGLALLAALAALAADRGRTRPGGDARTAEDGWGAGGDGRRPVLFLLFYLILPPAFILLLSYNTPKFNARYVMIAQPALLLLLAGGIAALWRRTASGRAARSVYGLAAALAVLFVAGLSGSVDRDVYGSPDFARPDFRAAIRYLGHHIEDDETVILTSGHMFPVFDYYAPKQERYLLPDSPTLDTTRILDYRIGADLNRWLAGKGGVWLVLWQDEVVDPVGYLTALLDGAGREEAVKKTFPKVRLKHYRLAPGARFSETGRPAIAHPADYDFGGRLRLLGYNQTGENQVTLYWEAIQPLSADYRVAIVLRDTANQAWGRWDGRPSSYLYPTDRWQAGQVVFGRYDLPQVPGRPPGDYGLEVGVYTEANPDGLDIVDLAGAPQGKRAMLGAVTLHGYIVDAAQIEIAHPGRTRIEGGLDLIGWDVSQAEVQPGDRVLLSLAWDVPERPRGDYFVRVLLSDAAGQTFDAGLYPPTNRWHPTSVWQAGQAWRGQITFRVPIHARPGDAALALQLVDATGAALGSPGTIGGVRILPTDRVFAAPRPQVPRPADFAGQVALVGADVLPDPVSPGSMLSIVLYWQAQAPMDVPYTVFVHLLTAGGQVLAQDDREPAGGTRPTTGWVPGEYVTDAHELPIPGDLAPGVYVIEVGLYDAGARGLPRLPLVGQEGQGAADRVIFAVQVQP